jgi:membrane protein
LNSKKWKKWYLNINQWSGARLDILKETIASSSKARASQAAASLAYYAIFSLFPLLLLLVIGSSYFLGSKQAYEGVTRFVQGAIPISTQLINENLQQILGTREAVGVIGFLTLLWSASGFFTILAYNINLAWPVASRRNFLADRLVGLGMIAGLSLLLLLSFGLDGAIKLIRLFKINNIFPLNIDLLEIFSMLGSWLMIFLLLLLLYRWVPKASVRWSSIAWGALIASIAWKAAIAAFGWYMGSSLQQYKLIYGSLGAVVALLLLIFILSLVMLLGAHLCAAIDKWEQEVKRKSK